MPTVVHFEVPADDLRRVKSFYTDLFCGKIEGIPGLDYMRIDTSEEDLPSIGDGIMRRQGPSQHIINYIDVDSLEEYSSRVMSLGEKVLIPKRAVPGVGYFAICLDTENNPFGILEIDEGAK
jgi:predicted enzyme related to lactoylglutathione lyase